MVFLASMSCGDKGVHPGKAGLGKQVSCLNDAQGSYIHITCGSVSGSFYLSKYDESKRSHGKCVLVGGKWYTPSEVETLGGKKARKWKQSLLHNGKPLTDYNLTCPATVTTQDIQITTVPTHNTVTSVRSVSPCSDVSLHSNNSPCTLTSMSSTSNMVSVGTNCTFLIDPALAFIKAFRLKGDANSLKRVVSERFSSDAVDTAKSLLWDSCSQLLEEAGMPYQSRRDSDRRSQLSANLEDIIMAFNALDTNDLIPQIFCEASDLVKLPPICLDPVAEQVELNSKSLDALNSTVQGLGEKLSSLFSTLSSSDITVDGTRTVASDVVGADSDTYARHASISFPSHSTSTALPFHRLPIPPASSRIDDRASNLILFGLSESPSIFETKKLVDEVLQFLAEGPVQIRDVFRLGKYNHNSNSSTRPRPVLIKLSTAWDRKAILLRKRNLQHFRISHLFLRADVPPHHQLRQAKTKAQSHVPSSFHSSVLVGKSVPSTVQVPSS